MRYFLDQDDDSHWYLIPLHLRDQRDAWRSLPDDDPASWDPPDFAQPVQGHPNQITFSEPV